MRRTDGQRAVTLAGELTFVGRGLHTGADCAVTLKPLIDDSGIVFSFGGRRYPITAATADGSRRSTLLVFSESDRVQTAEHLLSAIVGMELDDVLIAVDGPEIPILDGSAAPFAQAINKIGYETKADPRAARDLFTPTAVDWGTSSIVALPSEELRVTYIIDYPGSGLVTEMKDVVLTRESYLKEIAPARTYVMESDIARLREAGLALGGDLDNAIVIGDDGPINKEGYRIASECASHKVLDLLGDLALAGPRASAHYICVRGGHGLHVKLAGRLK